MIEWIFFDVGETLVDESDCYNEHFEKCCVSLNKLNIPITSFEYKKLVEKCYFTNTERPLHTVWTSFNSGQNNPTWSHENEKIYDSTYKVLKQLSTEYNLGVIANQSFGLSERLKDYDIEKFFKVIISSGEVGVKKPHPQIFELAMKEAKTRPENTMYVGDRIDNDIIPAKKLNMQTVRIKQGLGKLHAEHPVYQSDFTINSLAELPLLLKIK